MGSTIWLYVLQYTSWVYGTSIYWNRNGLVGAEFLVFIFISYKQFTLSIFKLI